MAKDVLPEAHESRGFKAATAKLVAEAKRGNTPQLDKFKEAARELECDNDEARFEERVKRIAKSPNSAPLPPPGDE